MKALRSLCRDVPTAQIFSSVAAAAVTTEKLGLVEVRLDEALPGCDASKMSSRSVWLKRGGILFAGAIVLRGLAERRPDKLAIISTVAGCFVAVVLIGWLFALRRER
ncbi:hypothetical protein CV103_18595 [Sphingomonas fennica]|uniref:Uncharacterized protein n=1 Tax=Edaphosphingomonas fennica TaxID=114404 RepID=A0A2T4HMP4_9SPHN|nr:hypothetical protein CV103_18595 [Sphingomonas fennica]